MIRYNKGVSRLEWADMNIGCLLEELIAVAQISKTDFAISMNMTPSGLSKLLTGRRLPLYKEKKQFCKDAARHLADGIYELRCYLKFGHLFPVIYDFNAQYELEMFLAQALEYALDKSFALEINTNLEYPEQEISYLGKKVVLNAICILFSDALMNEKDSAYDFYSSFPILSTQYAELFGRIKVLNINRSKNVTWHHYFAMQAFEAIVPEHEIDVLFLLERMEQYADFNLWTTPKTLDTSFLLLKGRFLLQLQIQLDGIILMTQIRHRSYLSVFFNVLMKQEAKKISYNRKEAIDVLKQDPLLLERLRSKGIDAVYNFISIGYLLTKEELQQSSQDEVVNDRLFELFQTILTEKIPFYVNVDAMFNIYITGKALVPLIGAVAIKQEERIPYLQRFDSYINEQTQDKIRILNAELPKMAIFACHGCSLIYLYDVQTDLEKLYYFETDLLNQFLSRKVATNTKAVMDFSPDLWMTYLSELARS